MANVTILSNLLTNDFRKKIGSSGSPAVEADPEYGDEAYYMDPFTGQEVKSNKPSDLIIELDRLGIELPERNKIAAMQGTKNFSFGSDTEKNEFNAKINTPIYEEHINKLIDSGLVEFNNPEFFKSFIKDSWDKKLDKDFFLKAEEKGLMSFPGELDNEYKLEGVNKFYAVYSPMFEEIKKNEYVKAIRPRNTANIKYEWTQVAFDLSQYGSIENQIKAKNIILESIAKPDMTFQGEPVKGFRPVLCYPIHSDQERAAHVQMWVHPTTLYLYEENGVKRTLVQPLTDINDSKGQAAILESINKNLRAAGLADVATIQSNRINKGVDAEAHNQARQAAFTGNLPELPAIEDAEPGMNTAQAGDYYRRMEEHQTRELADLFARQKALVDQINAAKAARIAVETNAILENENNKLSKELDNKTNIIEELKSSHKEEITSLNESHSNEIQAYIKKNNELAEQAEIAKRVPELEKEVAGLEEDNTALTKSNLYKARGFDRLLKIAKAIRDTLKNEVKLLKDKLFKVEEENGILKETNKELVSGNATLKSDNDKLKNENSTLKDKIRNQTETELEIEALKEENKLLKEKAKEAVRLKVKNTELTVNYDTQQEIIKLYEDTLVEKNIIKNEDRVIPKEEEEPKAENENENIKKGPKL
ncbi:TPA: hypothetical protein NNQ64_004941 [Salmonella enterica]|uniref:hypothetical protein n=1 Tax=Salmonella enterica TaxID=28901 RepID=UPI001DF0A6FF|nr:hypothetical protein [Salmonella enterica]EFQ9276448.1 hypothetical protein [Salmonella enterica]HCH8401416.1 hypothetical protein [Salmonella enterica]HCH8745766.1 hypothetical protein [Salmonella enterica]HCL7020252.1 hypothetical protein [Salmonella enterica]HCL7025379.1 hypothetical protein [Salmonella enterica]